MSLFSPIAHDGASQTRGLSRTRAGMAVLGLAIAVGVAYAIANNVEQASQPATAKSTGLAHEDFVRLNTEGLSYPQAATQAALGPADRFLEINTTDLESLVGAVVAELAAPANVSQEFWEINTTDLEGYAPAAVAEPHNPGVSEWFWEINTSVQPLSNRYSERGSGPR